MVVDSSAIVAVLRDEPEAESFVDAIASADDPIISAATVLEASMVMESRAGAAGVVKLDEFLAAAGIRIVALDDMQAYAARRAPTRLNLGDRFAYGLSITKNRPLLFKGDDFRQTNVEAAV